MDNFFPSVQNKINDQNATEFRTLGVGIDFPFQAYGIQKAMMSKLVSTLSNKEHSLIESPTGTGKTLVLLCATLAWQKKSKAIDQPFISSKLKAELIKERREKLMKKSCTCGRRPPNPSEYDVLKEAKENCSKKGGDCFGDEKNGDYGKRDYMLNSQTSNDFVTKKVKIEEAPNARAPGESPYFSKNNDIICLDDDEFDDDNFILPDLKQNIEDDIIIIDDEDDDLKPTKQHQAENENEDAKQKKQDDESVIFKSMCNSCMAIQADDIFLETLCDDNVLEEEDSVVKFRSRIPRIYYGTRTHKQISQVVRELNKTSYNQKLKMCILSSRERTCINDTVRDHKDRNDRCQELIKNKKSSESDRRKSKGETCPYYHDSNAMNQVYQKINLDYELSAWDIENANQFGKEYTACPYYGLRSLQEEADITFCPYNYILDPSIRSTMNINLKNSIIIFDEAHNIEEICRDSASFNIDTKMIDEFLTTINLASSKYIQGTAVMDAYQYFRNMLHNIRIYIANFKFKPYEKNNWDHSETHTMTTQEMTDQLNIIGLGPDCLAKMKQCLSALKQDDDDPEGGKSNKQPADDDVGLNGMQVQMLNQLKMTLEFMYTTNVKNHEEFRVVITKKLENGMSKRPSHKQQYAVGSGDAAASDVYIWQFSLLCMNPSVAFNKIHQQAWTVIVASGTLSPIESLKSELGCKFTNPFEGAHVISRERIFATIVSAGPSRVELNCGYEKSNSMAVQDDIGAVIKDICLTVPNGVLVFFPSYERMEKFHERWFAKGIVKDIEKSGKKLFRERRNISPAQFESELAKYNRLANTRGALLFAVFRGKVSEGIDFADNAARAVITIGIPYPNVKDVNVSLKRQYNDAVKSKRPELMTGSDWYSCQAFRALNQALGRCIRHKDDWGAIILIDSRLKQNNADRSLSKWLQRNMIASSYYSDISDNLKKFIEVRTQDQESVLSNQNNVPELIIDPEEFEDDWG